MEQVNTQVKARAAYLVQRDARKRYSFGPVWNSAVLAGKVTDRAKLVEHGFKLKVARSRSDVKKLAQATLLARVQAKLQANVSASQAAE